jgi:hypothetical protein
LRVDIKVVEPVSGERRREPARTPTRIKGVQAGANVPREGDSHNLCADGGYAGVGSSPLGSTANRLESSSQAKRLTGFESATGGTRQCANQVIRADPLGVE